MKTTRKQRDQLRTLEKKATRGPWRKPDDDGSTSVWRKQHDDSHVVTSYGTAFALGVDTAACPSEDDANFVSAARNSLVPLLDDLDEAERELELLRRVEEAAQPLEAKSVRGVYGYEARNLRKVLDALREYRKQRGTR